MILDILQLREFHHISLLGAGGKSTLRTILEDESARLGEARTFQEIGASDGRFPPKPTAQSLSPVLAHSIGPFRKFVQDST